MILAVLFILVMIVLLGWPSSTLPVRAVPQSPADDQQEIAMAAMFTAAAALSIATWLLGMRTGVRALQEMDDSFVASAVMTATRPEPSKA